MTTVDAHHKGDDADFDVAVVGCGPVGQLLAILLGEHGHRTVALDKWPEPYRLPRAVHYDDEIARVLASASVGDAAAAISEPADTYEWRNAAGQTLLKFDWSGPGESGWPRANMMSQPYLEAVLRRHLDSLPTVTVRRGEEVVELATASCTALATAAFSRVPVILACRRMSQWANVSEGSMRSSGPALRFCARRIRKVR